MTSGYSYFNSPNMNKYFHVEYLLRAYDGTCGDVGHVKQYWGKEEEKKPNMLSK